MKLSSNGARAFAIVVFLLLGTGTTVGDIGSSCQSPDELDPVAFFGVKSRIDCQRCNDCGLSGSVCDHACKAPPDTAFPEGCRPLVHDGEVCLHALQAASCAAYASYADPVSPTAPSECQFCPVR